jgi:hypothetical protein
MTEPQDTNLTEVSVYQRLPYTELQANSTLDKNSLRTKVHESRTLLLQRPYATLVFHYDIEYCSAGSFSSLKI